MGSRMMCAAVLPDGVHFVVGLGVGPNQGEVRLYHVDGTLVHTFEGHASQVNALAVTPDGQHIISGSHDWLVKVWSVADRSLPEHREGHRDTVLAVAGCPTASASSAARQHRPRWRAGVALDGTPKNTFRLHTRGVGALPALPDNQHALSGSTDTWADTTIKLFDVNDGIVLRTFKHHSRVTSLALLPDGLRFVSSAQTAPPASSTTASRRSCAPRRVQQRVVRVLSQLVHAFLRTAARTRRDHRGGWAYTHAPPQPPARSPCMAAR